MTTLVSEAMNRSPLSVPADASIATAAALAEAAGDAHLLVMDEENLVGILCGCDLSSARPDERVFERMSLPVITIRPDATLEDAALTLCECGVGCLPVALGGLVLGTVSGKELARAGVPALLPHRHCHDHPGRRLH
jgi:CBS domain-containing protein